MANSAFLTQSWATIRRVVPKVVSSSPTNPKTSVRRGRLPEALSRRIVDTIETIPALLSPVPRPKK
jgi:hypothetical protein